MRPSLFYIPLLVLLILVNCSFLLRAHKSEEVTAFQQMQRIAVITGLAEPSFTNEARYTRHPGLSDSLVPFMDHPGALEHFPSSAMLAVRPVP